MKWVCATCGRDEKQVETWMRFIDTATGKCVCVECLVYTTDGKRLSEARITRRRTT